MQRPRWLETQLGGRKCPSLPLESRALEAGSDPQPLLSTCFGSGLMLDRKRFTGALHTLTPPNTPPQVFHGGPVEW